MKVVFVHIVIGVTPAYSHAIASLAAVVCQAHHEVDLVVVRSNDFDKYAKIILDTKPDVVCISVKSNQWPSACTLVKTLKTYSREIPVWIGGSHIIANPLSFSDSDFDAACYGEGENLLPLALNSLKNGELFHNESWLTRGSHLLPVSSIVEDLDKLPLPKIEIFDRDDVLNYPSVIFSRGCPFGCTFCMSRLGGLGGKVRWKSVSRAVAETRRLKELFQPNEIYIDDDTFLKNPKWVKEFLQQYRQEVKLPFYCNARPEVVNSQICDILARSGCEAIGIGIESGSEKIRTEKLGRPMSNRQILNAFNTAHSAGLKTWSFNMVGIPGETIDDFIETVKLNEECKSDYVRLSVYTPYPGTPLGDSMGLMAMPRSYFDGMNLLSESLRNKVENWIEILRNQGRLWNG